MGNLLKILIQNICKKNYSFQAFLTKFNEYSDTASIANKKIKPSSDEHQNQKSSKFNFKIHCPLKSQSKLPT
jgi:hypothetical protein